MSTEAVKLPKNFAELVMNLELPLDSGNFTIDTVNELMQLSSQAVEYYSGMNDVRYIHFTERIQNMLIRPDILKLMNEEKMEGPRKEALQNAKNARARMRQTRTIGPRQMDKLDKDKDKNKSKMPDTEMKASE